MTRSPLFLWHSTNPLGATGVNAFGIHGPPLLTKLVRHQQVTVSRKHPDQLQHVGDQLRLFIRNLRYVSLSTSRLIYNLAYPSFRHGIRLLQPIHSRPLPERARERMRALLCPTVSLREVFQHLNVEFFVSDGLLQSTVLILKQIPTPRFLALHATVLLTPAMVSPVDPPV